MGDKVFKFGKEDGDKPEDRLFELSTFLNIIKIVTSE